MTPGIGEPHLNDLSGIPRRRTTGAQIIGVPELQPGEDVPTGQPLDGPPPSQKVDFENLPQFVWQRKMLHNVKLAAAGVFALLAALMLYFIFHTGKSTVKPIVDELQKENNGAELLRESGAK